MDSAFNVLNASQFSSYASDLILALLFSSRSKMFSFLLRTDIAMDWSDHALWWPERNHWLTRTRSTLDQYGVAADALLHFTPMHKTLRVQLPDMRCLDCRVDFSVKTFNAIINLCKELGECREPIDTV